MTTPWHYQARFLAGFSILFIWHFGLLGLALYHLIQWHPWTVIGLCALNWISASFTSRPVAWLTLLGAKPVES